MSATTIPTTTAEARRLGLVCVGEWGYGGPAGYFWCRPQDEAAVRAAYDAMPDGPCPTAECDADILAAGGVWVPDVDEE